MRVFAQRPAGGGPAVAFSGDRRGRRGAEVWIGAARGPGSARRGGRVVRRGAEAAPYNRGMWIVDSEFDGRTGRVFVVSAMLARRPGSLRQWMEGGAAAAWLAGRRVCGFQLAPERRLLGVDGGWDVWEWLYVQWPELRGASLDELMRQNLDIDLLIHGADPVGGWEMVGRRLREASANSVRVVDMLLYVMRVRGGIRWEGRWWEIDVGDLLARLGG